MNYYNDNDKFSVKWLEALIADGLIPNGVVDDRSINEIRPSELDGFTQCHFFAGIGGWPYALRLAGWPDDRPVWTGSCPCQPFSVAGKGEGLDDERHLWPAFRWLIAQCRPSTVFGEQVASKDGRSWLTGVRTDLEAMGYAVGAADLCAAGIGAPHIRQRLFWVADSKRNGWRSDEPGRGSEGRAFVGRSGESCDGRVADSIEQGLEGHAGDVNRGNEPGRECKEAAGSASTCGPDGRVGNAIQPGSQGRTGEQIDARGQQVPAGRAGHYVGLGNANGERRTGERLLLRAETTGRDEGKILQTAGTGQNGFWSNSILIPCADGKARRVPGRWVAKSTDGKPENGNIQRVGVIGLHQTGGCCDGVEGGKQRETTTYHLEIEPALFPLADGLPSRVGLLRGAGNAICPQLAAEFIKSFTETEEEK
jgi:DNA (cytosine-5)-methyltransferase 1